MEIKFLSGYKTYIAGFLLLIWAIYAGVDGIIDGAEAIKLILLALSIIGLRSAVANLKEE
jgi:hypothetical protein